MLLWSKVYVYTTKYNKHNASLHSKGQARLLSFHCERFRFPKLRVPLPECIPLCVQGSRRGQELGLGIGIAELGVRGQEAGASTATGFCVVQSFISDSASMTEAG